MARTRDTKARSQRIDREYFKRLYPIPKWRRILSLAFCVVGLVWVGWSMAGTSEVFSAGPLAKKHHLLGAKCETCHVEGTAVFGREVTDMGCVTCHDGPAHMPNQVQADIPACASCHVDHRGAFSLAAVTNSGCTGCHSNLKTSDGKMNIAASITGFATDDGHPKFRSELGKLMDTGTIKFGHEVHMKADLRGPNGPTQLQCSTCHKLQVDGAMSLSVRATDCDSCHRLEFYRRIPDVLPHDKPEVVTAYALRTFTKYIEENPDDVNREDPPLDPRIIQPREGPAGNAPEWIRRRMEETQILMARKTCIECHTPVMSSGVIQSIPPANTPKVWMTKARFQHKAHMMVACASCHANVEKSKLTSDVLMPGIQSCQGCHHAGSSGADATCSECHNYHDWGKAKVVEPKFRVEDFLR